MAPTVSSGWPPERCQRSRSRTTTSASASRGPRRRSRSCARRRSSTPAPRAPAGTRRRAPLRVGDRGSGSYSTSISFERVLGQVAAVRDDHRDALADVPDLLRGQAAPGVLGRVGPEVGHRVAQLGGLRPGGSPRARPARPGPRRSRSGTILRVRERAAQDGGVQGARGDPVGDVAAPAEQELRVLDPADGLAHPAPLAEWSRTGGAPGRWPDSRRSRGDLLAVARIRAAALITASVMNW